MTMDTNPYAPPHASDLQTGPPRPARLTFLAARWLGVHCAVAALDAAILLVVRTHLHQIHTPFPSLASTLIYVVPRFLRTATYGGLAVSFLKGHKRFGPVAFGLELLSLAASANSIAAIVTRSSDALLILPSLAGALGVAGTGLLAFGPPRRLSVWTGIGIVCLSAALKATPLLALM